jgi:hypothetical protein
MIGKSLLPSLRILALAFLVLMPWKGLFAQIVVDEAPRGLYYERTARVKKFKDMKDFRDVFHKDKFLLGRNRISGNISYNTGRVLIDDGREVHGEYRQALGFFTRIRFFEEFSFNATFYKDFNPKATARWTSDYSYSIGRYNWRPNRFNYGYENYINNKYKDDLATFGEKFLEGYYFISYSRMLSEKLTKRIRLDSTSSVRFTALSRYSINYRNEREEIHGGLFSGKPYFGLSIRHTVFWNIYIEGAVYYYVSAKYLQQPWDPDYSYGFGYFDWRSFRVSVTYGNWAINRFPWKKTAYPKYGFIDGNFKIAANYIW